MRKMNMVLILFFSSLLTTQAQFTTLFEFTGLSATGTVPGGLLYTDSTNIYGYTSSGGTSDFGVLYKMKLDGSGFMKLHVFGGYNGTPTDGGFPVGGLISVGAYLYGMTGYGGNTGGGEVFKIKPDGSGYTMVCSLPWTNACCPSGSLYYDGVFLYGLASGGGGSQPGGSVFKVKPDGSAYTDLHDFNGADGSFPLGTLVSDGTYLYGMTNGDALYISTIFKIKPDGSNFSVLTTLPGVKGNSPNGSLLFDGTYLYGTSKSGGAAVAGNIFKIKPDGSDFQDIHDFHGPDGVCPAGTLVTDGTFLYGVTSGGALSDSGSIYQIKPDGADFSTLYTFSKRTGYAPQGLMKLGDCLYGTTQYGGASTDSGTVFKYCILPEVVNPTVLILYPNPAKATVTIETKRNTQQELSLFDSEGRLVSKQEFLGSTIIDISHFASGLYLARINGVEGELSKPLVISK